MVIVDVAGGFEVKRGGSGVEGGSGGRRGEPRDSAGGSGSMVGSSRGFSKETRLSGEEMEVSSGRARGSGVKRDWCVERGDTFVEMRDSESELGGSGRRAGSG